MFYYTEHCRLSSTAGYQQMIRPKNPSSTLRTISGRGDYEGGCIQEYLILLINQSYQCSYLLCKIRLWRSTETLFDFIISILWFLLLPSNTVFTTTHKPPHPASNLQLGNIVDYYPASPSHLNPFTDSQFQSAQLLVSTPPSSSSSTTEPPPTTSLPIYYYQSVSIYLWILFHSAQWHRPPRILLP